MSFSHHLERYAVLNFVSAKISSSQIDLGSFRNHLTVSVYVYHSEYQSRLYTKSDVHIRSYTSPLYLLEDAKEIRF